MLHPTLTRVLGEPTHKQVHLVIQEFTANLMAVSCPWGHNKGHLGLQQDLAIYLAHNTSVFTIPANEPSSYPRIPAGATAQAQEEIQATNISTRKAWATYRLVLAITITHDQFAAAIDDVYYALSIQLKDFTASTSARSSNTFSQRTPRSANPTWTTT